MLPRLVLLLGLLFGFIMMAAAEVQPSWRVGFSQDTLANDWRRAQAEQMAATLSQWPDIDFELKDAGGHTPTQIKQIEDFIAAGIDLLIVSPRDGHAMSPVVSAAFQQGIPVVLLTRRIVSEDFTVHVGPDDYQIGQRAADAAAELLQGKGNVLVLKGVPTATTTIARQQGFEQQLTHYPGLRIVASRYANFLRSDAIRVMEELLEKGIAFDAIYAHSDSMASGARMVLKAFGRHDDTAKIIGIDYITEAQTAIEAGEQAVSFSYPTSATEAAKLVRAILDGNDVPRRVLVESIKITRDNANNIEPIF